MAGNWKFSGNWKLVTEVYSPLRIAAMYPSEITAIDWNNVLWNIEGEMSIVTAKAIAPLDGRS